MTKHWLFPKYVSILSCKSSVLLRLDTDKNKVYTKATRHQQWRVLIRNTNEFLLDTRLFGPFILCKYSLYSHSSEIINLKVKEVENIPCHGLLAVTLTTPTQDLNFKSSLQNMSYRPPLETSWRIVNLISQHVSSSLSQIHWKILAKSLSP